MELIDYAKILTNSVLDNDDPRNKPLVRNRYSLVRASGWLKGSDRTMFLAIFVYEELNALRVNVRCNRKGCFHYPAIPKTEMTTDKLDRIAKIIISDVNKHMEATK